MDITPVIPSGRNVIKAYGDMGFKINDAEYSGSIILLPEKIDKWAATSHAEITIESLKFITDNPGNIEILLIGCGATHAALPQDISSHFSKMDIGVEMMTTGAACRTYNVLLAEGRNMAAALIAV